MIAKILRILRLFRAAPPPPYAAPAPVPSIERLCVGGPSHGRTISVPTDCKRLQVPIRLEAMEVAYPGDEDLYKKPQWGSATYELTSVEHKCEIKMVMYHVEPTTDQLEDAMRVCVGAP